MSKLLKQFTPHLAAIIIFIAACSFYFYPQFQGKVLSQGDLTQYKGMASEISEYRKTGDNILWTNSMFSGMPTFQLGALHKTNLINKIHSYTRFFMKSSIGYYFRGMLYAYLALLVIGINPWLAIIGALAFALNSNTMIIFEAGHNSKVHTLLSSILIVSGLIAIFQKRTVVGFLAFTYGMAASIGANHYQMTYYLALALAPLFIIGILFLVLDRDIKNALRVIILLTLGTLLAVGVNISALWTTYEYSKETMRGKQILEKVEDQGASNHIKNNGLEWSYAMNWSNNTKDLVALYIPGFVGGRSSEKISKSSSTNKLMRKYRQKNLSHGPLYWGNLPFTSGPQYMGAVSMFLFVFALFFVSKQIRIWAIIAFFLTTMISLGSSFDGFNRFLFDNVPLFNKFRSPCSITAITSIIISVVGILGVQNFFSQLKENDNSEQSLTLKFIISVCIALLPIIFILLFQGMFDFSSAGDQRYAQNPELLEAFIKDRKSLMRSDALRTLLFVGFSAGALFALIKRYINVNVFILIIGILMISDIWGIDRRYLNADNFQTKRNKQKIFNERTVDKTIKKDKDLFYRVHDLTINTYNSAMTSFHHKTIGGYHAAKLRRYQDIIDNHLQKGGQNILNMLNMKYLITGQPGKENVQQNPNAFGNAWFVNDIRVVNTNREEINSLDKVDLRKTAIVHKEFEEKLGDKTFSKQGDIKLVNYHPDKMVYESNSQSNELAVFSEVWYSKGWSVSIDGQPAELIRANYILRAVEVPAGKHQIILEFKPKSFYTGAVISLIASIIFIGILAFFIYKTISSKTTEE